MTLAIAVATPNAIIIAADRRLSCKPGLDQFLATKLFTVKMKDAHGILTYAGVGANVSGDRPFELSAWLERTLTGGQDFTFDEAITAICQSATKRRLSHYFPHTFMFAGFLRGRPIIETLTSEYAGEIAESYKKQHGHDFVRFRPLGPGRREHGGAYVIGSGRSVVFHRQARARYTRQLQTLSRSLSRSPNSPFERHKSMALLAAIIRDVSRSDPKVSAESLCAWADRRSIGTIKSYSGRGFLVENGEYIPAVSRGIGMRPVLDYLAPIQAEMIAAMHEKRPPNLHGLLPAPGTNILKLDSNDKF